MYNRERLNALSAVILDSCIEVHKELGPGLLESVYEYALIKEFELRGIKAVNRVGSELHYKGQATGKFYEIDLLVEDAIVIELKAVDNMNPVYEAQIISYLKLSNRPLGFLVNFNVPKIKDGFRRFVNNF